MANAPKRACRFVLDLEADTRDDLATALYNMASLIERGEMTIGVSGGYSSGYIYELIENDRPTHDEYTAQLRAYLAEKKKVSDGVHPSFAPTGEVIELDYERCLVLVRLDADIPPAMEVKQRVALEPEASTAGEPLRNVTMRAAISDEVDRTDGVKEDQRG